MAPRLIETVDLQAIAKRLHSISPYAEKDAPRDVQVLVGTVRALEDRQVVAARPIRLAIEHGTAPAAPDRLEEAMVEPELPAAGDFKQSRAGSPGTPRPALVRGQGW